MRAHANNNWFALSCRILSLCKNSCAICNSIIKQQQKKTHRSVSSIRNSYVFFHFSIEFCSVLSVWSVRVSMEMFSSHSVKIGRTLFRGSFFGMHIITASRLNKKRGAKKWMTPNLIDCMSMRTLEICVCTTTDIDSICFRCVASKSQTFVILFADRLRTRHFPTFITFFEYDLCYIHFVPLLGGEEKTLSANKSKVLCVIIADIQTIANKIKYIDCL